MYTLFALLTKDKLVLKISTLRRNMFDVINSHNMSIEEMKDNDIYPAVKERKEFNPETHREHIEWQFDIEQDIVLGKVTIFKKDKPKVYTKFEFRNLFTQNEKIALYEASKTDTILKIALDDLAVTEYVELINQRTIDYMQYLIAKGILTQERYNEIYAGLI